MKILLCTNDFPPVIGGIQAYSYNTAKNLSDLGEEVIVLVFDKRSMETSGFDEKQSFKIVRVKSSLAMYLAAIRLISVHRFDLLYLTHRANFLRLGYLAKRFFKIPYFLKVHGKEYVVCSKEGFVRKAIEGAKKVVVTSKFLKNDLVKYGVDEEKIALIHDGVDIEKFDYEGNGSKIREKHKLDDKKVLLTVSRLVKRKGHENVIKALPMVLEKFSNTVYVVVGDGDERENLKKLAEETEVKESVIFTGFVPFDDLLGYYDTCDCYVMPSMEIEDEQDIEGFGLSFVEAGARRKAVVGGRSGGITDSVDDGKSGILVDPLNIDEIAEAVVKLFSDDRLRTEMGGFGRRRAEEEFNWRVMGQRLQAVIKENV